MKRIVLVHGSGHGAWCWERILPRLAARGILADTLDLPGLGDDPTPPAKVSLQAYIDRVADIVAAGPGPVLLVGHSMGGMAISGAAEAVPEKIGRLVYLAAILPADGETLLSGWSAPNEGAARALQAAGADDAFAFDPALAPDIFYNSCPPEDAARATARLRPQAAAPLNAPIALSAARWGQVPKTYVMCRQDAALPLRKQDFYCRRVPDMTVHAMETDHSPFYSDPDRLTEILVQELAR